MAIVWCRETSRWEMGSHRGVWVWVGEFYTFVNTRLICMRPLLVRRAWLGDPPSWH